MSYNYHAQRYRIFTEEGQTMLLLIQDRAREAIAFAGAVRAGVLMAAPGVSGDVWDMMACMDRLIELNYLKEVTGASVPGQYRVFVAGHKWAKQD